MAEEKIKITDGDTDELRSGWREDKLDQWKRKIDADVQWSEAFYSERNREFDKYKRWYYKEHYNISLIDQVNQAIAMSGDEKNQQPSNIEDEHLSVINIPTNVIDTAHTMIMNEFPHIEALSSKDSASSNKRQTDVERFLVGTYYINRQVQGQDAIADSLLNALIFGWGCIRCLWDIDREDMLRESKDGFAADYMFPIVVQSISPYMIYPIPGGRFERYRAVIYRAIAPKEQLEEEWGVDLTPEPAEGDENAEVYDNEPVEYIDYWCWEGTRIYNAVMANGRFLKEPAEMPEYDSLPYEIFFCREGPDKNSGDKIGLSFMFTLLEAVRELELLSNRELRAIELYADPPLVTIKNPENPPVDVQTGPGSRIELEAGENAFWLNWTGSAPDMARAKDFWGKLIESFSFPDIASGVVGGTSGLDTIALQQGGMAKVFTPRQNLEQALERLNTKIIRLFQKRSAKEKLHIRGLRTESDEEHTFSFDIAGKDTKGYEYTKVTIRAKFPQEELRNAAIAQGLVAADLYSARDVMSKFLFVQDPERMVTRRNEEKASSDPLWTQHHIQQLLAKPPQSPIGKALQEGGTGPVATDADKGEDLPPPPGGIEAAATNTIAGAGAAPAQSLDNPLTAIQQQAKRA